MESHDVSGLVGEVFWIKDRRYMQRKRQVANTERVGMVMRNKF